MAWVLQPRIRTPICLFLRGESLSVRRSGIRMRRCAQRGVMVKATPPSPLVVAEPEFLFQVLVVALDPPSQLGSVHQAAAADVCGQRGQKVFRWLRFVGGPFDQAPFLGTRCGAFIIAMRGADTYGREAPGELDIGPFAPGHPPPSL